MKSFFISLLVLLLVFFWVTGKGDNSFFKVAQLGKEVYSQAADLENVLSIVSTSTTATTTQTKVISHVKAPEHVKAIYMSSWVAGTPSVRERLLKLIDETELNAVVIDVKDNTGVLSWDGRIRDLDTLIEDLHAKNIYVIARIAAFQDPAYVKLHPEQAVMNITTGKIWRDRKGEPWVDTGSRDMWKYLVNLGKETHARGFDELNYDYIRFPTDGDLQAMRFPVSGERGLTDKRAIVQEFYKYLHDELRPLGIPISGDVFGIITTNSNETKTLGQDLGDALMYFDYVAPMVYPSHFYPGTAGYQNPAANPGPIISYSMGGAILIINQVASSTRVATSTLIAKLRPWYQDFDMGATYTAEMVRAQIKAGERLDVNSWMLWDPANKYTPSALLRE